MTPTDHHLAYRKNIIIAVLLTCIGYGFYNIGDAALKTMASRFHFSQIIFINSSFIILFMAVYGWIKEGKKAFRTKKPGWLLARGTIAQVTALTNIYALPHIHLTTFYTLVFTAPLWVALLASYFLKDKLGKRRLGVILFGFCVILFIFRPGGGMLNIWSLLVLLGTFAYSCQMVMIRHIGSGESRPFMFLCGSVIAVLLAFPFLFTHYVTPTPYEWGLFLMMAITGSIGLLCISYAIQSVPSSSIVTPYHYTQIVWGALLGYYLFHEVPSLETMGGAVLIILSGLYLVYHETRRSASLAPVETSG